MFTWHFILAGGRIMAGKWMDIGGRDGIRRSEDCAGKRLEG